MSLGGSKDRKGRLGGSSKFTADTWHVCIDAHACGYMLRYLWIHGYMHMKTLSTACGYTTKCAWTHGHEYRDARPLVPGYMGH